MTKFFSVLFRGRDLRDNVQKCRWLQARGVSLYKASCEYIQYLEKPSLSYGHHTLWRGPWGPGEVENAKLFYKIDGLDKTIP